MYYLNAFMESSYVVRMTMQQNKHLEKKYDLDGMIKLQSVVQLLFYRAA